MSAIKNITRNIMKILPVAALILMLFLSGCKSVPPLTAADVEGYTPDTGVNDTRYYFYGGFLVGSWSDGEWRSLNDVSGDSEESNLFLLKDILLPRQYALYGREKSLGMSNEMLITTSDFMGGFPTDMTEKLTPYSEKISEQYVDPRLFRLPVKLSTALSATAIPDNAFYVGFTQSGANTNTVLATNSSRSILPKSISYNGEPTTADKEQINNMLKAAGITTVPNLTGYVRADFDNDGYDECLIVAHQSCLCRSSNCRRKERKRSRQLCHSIIP